MLSIVRARLTYANVLSTLCLFMLLGGGAYAASTLPDNSVGTEQIQRNGVTKPDIDRGAVGSAELRRKSVKSPEVKNGTLKCEDFGDPSICESTTAPGAGLTTTVVRSQQETIEMGGCEDSASSRSCTGTETVSASCLAGEVATGGSVVPPPISSGFTSRTETTVGSDRPDPATGTPTGWTGEATSEGSSAPGTNPPNQAVTVYVVCAS